MEGGEGGRMIFSRWMLISQIWMKFLFQHFCWSWQAGQMTTVEDVALKLQGSWYLIYDQGPLYEIVGFKACKGWDSSPMQDLLYLLRHFWACVYPLRSQRVAPLRFRPFLPPRFPLFCASKKRIADSCDMWKSTCITSLMQKRAPLVKLRYSRIFFEVVEPSRKTSRFDLRYRDAFLKAFIDSYAENGGPKLDLEPIRLEGMDDFHFPKNCVLMWKKRCWWK